MKIIKSKLSKINKYWNEYYFVKKFFQKKINFTDEVKTNYYGDLNNYLNDTIDLITPFKNIKTDKEYISQTIVLMQVIYTHQDLIDELLYIFKISQSSQEDKNPNRKIRNELVGHPISRGENNTLKSSVLFDIRNENINYISYAKYSKENSFKPDIKKYSVNEIIKRHKVYLNKYLDEILNKIKREINTYQKQKEKIFQIPLYKQFEYIDKIDKSLLSDMAYIFEKENLKYYYKNLRKHRRYLYCMKQYKRALKFTIKEEISKNKFINLIELYDYEQLQKKDKVFTIDFYIKKYKNNSLIIEELKNMKSNINNNAEYYASLNFLWENELPLQNKL